MKSARIAKQAARVVLKIYQANDAQVQAAVKEKGATCRPGCNHCCKLPASATLPEAVLIAERLIGRTDWPKRRPQLLAEVRRQLHVHATNGVRTDYFNLQIPCVFLRDGKCEVYDIRPAVCRYHYVISPPENCAHGAADPGVKMINLQQVEQFVLVEGCKALGELVGGPLPAAMAIAMQRLGESFDVNEDDLRKTITASQKPAPRGRYL